MEFDEWSNRQKERQNFAKWSDERKKSTAQPAFTNYSAPYAGVGESARTGIERTQPTRPAPTQPARVQPEETTTPASRRGGITLHPGMGSEATAAIRQKKGGERVAATWDFGLRAAKEQNPLVATGQVDTKAKESAAAKEKTPAIKPDTQSKAPVIQPGQETRIGITSTPAKSFTFSQSPKAEIPKNRFSGEDGTALSGLQARTGMVPIPSSVDVSSENLLEAVPLGAYTNNWDISAAGAPAASVFANMDDETMSQLIIDYSDQMRRLKSLGLLESDSGWKDYFGRSANQFALGNFSNDNTLLGTAAQVGLSLAGLDLPMDIRDLTYDLTNWEWTPGHVGQTLLDAVGLLPVIGSLKYMDEAADLLGSMDEVRDVLGSVPEIADLAKKAPELGDLARDMNKLDDVLGSTNEAVDLLGSADEVIKGTGNYGRLMEKARNMDVSTTAHQAVYY